MIGVVTGTEVCVRDVETCGTVRRGWASERPQTHGKYGSTAMTRCAEAVLQAFCERGAGQGRARAVSQPSGSDASRPGWPSRCRDRTVVEVLTMMISSSITASLADTSPMPL